MIRRQFLKRMALAAIASGLLGDIPFPSEEPDEPSSLVALPRGHFKAYNYTLGFKVTQEMLEDDVYGDYMPKWNSELMTRFRVQP